MFALADKSGDGVLTKDECDDAMKALKKEKHNT
jgi:hypothetical protein